MMAEQTALLRRQYLEHRKAELMAKIVECCNEGRLADCVDSMVELTMMRCYDGVSLYEGPPFG